MSEPQDSETVDFDSRELCPDGGCTGIIGSDGRCKECGRAGGPKGERSTARADADDGDDSDNHSDAAAARGADAGDLPLEFADRKLCPDGACIGVLGADGRCKVCGAVA